MLQISARNLTKVYRIYPRPIDRLFEALFRKPRHQAFTALQNITFSLHAGGTLGVIGDNGAGKSTLLKLLVGTVTPTSGKLHVEGRVAALLELGAGFHPEFTGRQNIFLNAALMGIERDEILRKEDAIIEFSGLGEFIDRPVKMYSSGMNVRLAFAIATSVNPDILVIDEALAVGDMAFQQKCVERMHQFQEQGKTMILCSHSMYLVRELCSMALWLEEGRAFRLGPAQEVTEEYEDQSRIRAQQQGSTQSASSDPAIIQQKDCQIVSLGIETPDGTPTDTIEPLTDVVLTMEVKILRDQLTPQFGFALIMEDESIYSMALTHHDQVCCGPYRAGDHVRVRLHIKDFPFRKGTYKLVGGVAEKQGLLWHEMHQIWPVKIAGNSGHGLVLFKRKWDLEVE